MIIGNGAIASVIKDKKYRLFFASGVSNSSEKRESEYQVEKDLLNQIPKQFKKEYQIVYFSSIGVFNRNTRYFRHKREMESLIKKWPSYAIVRIGNITWKNNNPNTIINSFKDRIKNKKRLDIKNEYRYLVDKEEFNYWLELLPKWNVEINIVGRKVKIYDIVKEIKQGKL